MFTPWDMNSQPHWVPSPRLQKPEGTQGWEMPLPAHGHIPSIQPKELHLSFHLLARWMESMDL